MNEDNKKVVNWNEEGENYEEERHSLNDMVGEEMIIKYAVARESENYGKYLIVTDNKGKEYYSFSKLILRQFIGLSEILTEGKSVRAKIRINKRRQVYFAKPDGE